MQCWLSAFLVRLILILLSLNSTRFSIVSKFSLFTNLWIQTTFFAACPRAIYLALVVEVETVLCFLLLHNTTLLLKKKPYAITDFRSAGFLARLLLAYPVKPYGAGSIAICPYIKHNCIVFFRYRTTLFTTLRWLFLGSALFLLSQPIVKVISGLVPNARYINLPISHWYSRSSISS